MLYDYEYFCGANVVIELDGVQVSELSGLSYSIQETKRPIYGYSSRFYDAVARGQVLVRGSLMIPFVHRDYLFEVIRLGKLGALNQGPRNTSAPPKTFDSALQIAEALQALEGDPIGNAETIAALQAQYWDIGQTLALAAGQNRLSGTFNPHDMDMGFNISISYGARDQTNQYNGLHKQMLSDCQIVSRGSSIQISEDCIMEEYGFFARNLWSINTPEVKVATVDMQAAPDASTIET